MKEANNKGQRCMYLVPGQTGRQGGRAGITTRTVTEHGGLFSALIHPEIRRAINKGRRAACGLRHAGFVRAAARRRRRRITMTDSISVRAAGWGIRGRAIAEKRGH